MNPKQKFEAALKTQGLNLHNYQEHWFTPQTYSAYQDYLVWMRQHAELN